MTEPALTLRRLAWLLRARGPDLATWPERERHAALALARADADAGRLLADALEDETAPEPDAESLCRLQRRVRHALAPLGRGMRWGILAVCLGAGLYVGLTPPETDTASDPAVTVQATAPATIFASLDQ